MNERGALAEYLEHRRQLKGAWDSFHRRAYRQTFIHCRLALDRLMRTVLLLVGKDPGEDPLQPFFAAMGDLLPLDRAEAFARVLAPEELRSPGPLTRDNLSDSVDDWLITRSIPRPRAFEQVVLTQDTVNLVLGLMEKRFPGFLGGVGR